MVLKWGVEEVVCLLTCSDRCHQGNHCHQEGWSQGKLCVSSAGATRPTEMHNLQLLKHEVSCACPSTRQTLEEHRPLPAKPQGLGMGDGPWCVEVDLLSRNSFSPFIKWPDCFKWQIRFPCSKIVDFNHFFQFNGCLGGQTNPWIFLLCHFIFMLFSIGN